MENLDILPAHESTLFDITGEDLELIVKVNVLDEANLS